jgi:hypothetical protein
VDVVKMAGTIDVSRKRPSLRAVQAHCFSPVVDDFSRRFRVSKRESRDVFRETTKWLWLSNEFDSQRPVAMRGGPVPATLPVLSNFRVIDEMWHMFMLYTTDYCRFCESFFGAYIHHFPGGSWRRKRKIGRAVLVWFVDYVSDNLGEATAMKWLVDYPARYGSLALL